MFSCPRLQFNLYYCISSERGEKMDNKKYIKIVFISLILINITILCNKNEDISVLKKIYHKVKEIDNKLDRNHKPVIINLANSIAANPIAFCEQKSKIVQASSSSSFFAKLGLLTGGAMALFVPMAYYMSKLKNKLKECIKKEHLQLVSNNAKDIAIQTLSIMAKARK